MTRENTMTSVRGLAGAAALAAALLVTAAQPAPAQTALCMVDEGTPAVCGHVFTEGAGGNDQFDPGEGTGDVTVVVFSSAGDVVSGMLVTPSNPATSGPCADGQDQEGCGYYRFFIPEPPPAGETYLVCIVVDGETPDCRDAAAHPETGTVTFGRGPQIVDFEVPSGQPPSEDDRVWGVGTGTPGYWKNHPEAWPIDGVVIGDTPGRQWTLTKAQALAYLGSKVSGDKTITIFSSLVSAILNTELANNTSCIDSTIADAQHWFSLYGPAGAGVKARSDAWVGGPTNVFKAGEPLHQKMDDYNNGLLCAPHRD
jgi:hypothetical protein